LAFVLPQRKGGDSNYPYCSVGFIQTLQAHFFQKIAGFFLSLPKFKRTFTIKVRVLTPFRDAVNPQVNWFQ
jgi:hypothetical protein